MKEPVTKALTSSELTLTQFVEQAMSQYFANLDGQPSTNVYDMVLKEVERALLKVTLQQTQGNQSQAALLLGLARGTLRKKLQRYHLNTFCLK
jgi:Fis family transcriptional regulator